MDILKPKEFWIVVVDPNHVDCAPYAKGPYRYSWWATAVAWYSQCIFTKYPMGSVSTYRSTSANPTLEVRGVQVWPRLEEG